MKVDVEKLKLIIAKMINDENDDHTKLIQDINERLGLGSELVSSLCLVHSTKIDLLEHIYKKLQNV